LYGCEEAGWFCCGFGWLIIVSKMAPRLSCFGGALLFVGTDEEVLNVCGVSVCAGGCC
jgi:predicted phage tail protein